MSRISKFIGAKSRLVVSRGWRDGGTGFPLEVIKMCWNKIVVMVAQLCKYTKNY